MNDIKTLTITTKSVDYLIKKDKRFSKVVNMVGDITYKPYEDSYSFLISQIIGQMLSAKVGKVIYERLLFLCNNKITPQVINSLSDEEIKGIGTSNSKVKFIRELTSALISRITAVSVFNALPNSSFVLLTSFFFSFIVIVYR